MLTEKQIKVKIAGVARSTKAMRENVQEILINIAGHVYVHKDVTLYQSLFDATSGMNRKRIVKWIKDHGFANVSKDGKFTLNRTMHKESDFADGEHVVKWLTANAPEWWADEESAKKIAQELDVAKRIQSLAKQVKDARENNKVVKVDFAEFRKAQQELAAALEDAEKMSNVGDSRMIDATAN